MTKFNSVLNRLNKSRSIMALQEASISLVPMILTVTFLLMLSKGLAFFSTSPIIAYISDIHFYFYVFFPLTFTVTLAISFAKSKAVDPTSLIIISISLLTLSVVDGVTTIQQLKDSTYFKIIPIPLCYVSAYVLKYFASKSSLHVFKADYMSFHLSKTFNYILPSVITFAVVFLLFTFFESVWQDFTQHDSINQFQIEDTDNLLTMVLVKVLFKLTWFFGVNPSHVFSFIQSPYYDAFAANKVAFAFGFAIPHIQVPGTYYFTEIGGAGSVFCLLLAIVLFSKINRHKQVAKMSVLPCTFNISEILHYGLPIVFNPFLFVPFILVPIVLHLNTVLFMTLGLVSPVVVSVPWTTPALLNVYLATGGDLFAVLLQLFNLSIGTVIYLKFLRMLEASHIDEGLVDNFVERFNLETREIQAIQYQNQQSLMKNLETENEINAFLLQLSHGELVLYYQPIFDVKTKKVAKVEALLRLRDENDNIILPKFINLLSEVSLSIYIDRWVVTRAVKQSHDWSDKFNGVEISINISPSSLLDRKFVDFLINMHKKSIHPFCIEILENQANFEAQKINQHLKNLRDNGVTIYLDDFGSGFSALSMLPKLNINGVKYDIEFANQLHDKAGTGFFKSCLSISKALHHKTVLEGVETKDQYRVALDSGVDFIQGFYLCKPLRHDHLEAFINATNNNSKVKPKTTPPKAE